MDVATHNTRRHASMECQKNKLIPVVFGFEKEKVEGREQTDIERHHSRWSMRVAPLSH